MVIVLPGSTSSALDLELGADLDAVLLSAGLDDCVHGSSGLVLGDRARRSRCGTGRRARGEADAQTEESYGFEHEPVDGRARSRRRSIVKPWTSGRASRPTLQVVQSPFCPSRSLVGVKVLVALLVVDGHRSEWRVDGRP